MWALEIVRIRKGRRPSEPCWKIFWTILGIMKIPEPMLIVFGFERCSPTVTPLRPSRSRELERLQSLMIWLIVLMIALHEPSAADDEMDLTSEIAGFRTPAN